MKCIYLHKHDINIISINMIFQETSEKDKKFIRALQDEIADKNRELFELN